MRYTLVNFKISFESKEATNHSEASFKDFIMD